MPDSRERILDTAFELVRAQGANAVTMAAIADAAGVSRQMVYVHFRSRAGLLTAMARDRDRRSGFADRVAAARELPPAKALERLLREWLAYVPEILPVARALEAGHGPCARAQADVEREQGAGDQQLTGGGGSGSAIRHGRPTVRPARAAGQGPAVESRLDRVDQRRVPAAGRGSWDG